MCSIVTSQVPLLQHCDVMENNSIGHKTAIPLNEKFKSLMNINEWTAHVQSKQFTSPLNQWFARGMGDNALEIIHRYCPFPQTNG